MDTLNRRRFLETSLAASTTAVLGQLPIRRAVAADFTKPVPAAKGLTAYHNGSNILLRHNNLPILGYRAHSSLKYPYFSPLNGPVSGLSLTAESALPYPHHRGLWLGCDPVNGGNYWADNALDTGQIRSTHLKLETDKQTSSSVSFVEQCVWHRKDSTPFQDARQYQIQVMPNRQLWIDCEFQVTAQEDVSIKSAKHSFFALRAAADISPSYGGTLINSRGGVNAKGTYGKQAEWCGYFGKRRLRPDVVEGIVIMNHPDNFGGDCPWFTRDYGHLSPSPFNFLSKPWTIAKGDQLQLKYRVVLFSGTPQAANLNDTYKNWLG